MKKVLVIGCPGSGKSTFSRRLRDITGLPIYHLDVMNWNADKSLVDRTVFHKRLKEVLEKDKWILDGMHPASLEERMQVCDTVFFLDYPLELCMEAVLSRKSGQPRSDAPWTDPEKEMDDGLRRFMEGFRVQDRPRIFHLMEQYPGVKSVVFTGRAQADRYLEDLAGLSTHG